MTSWQQQYDRMLRSFERLTAMAEGRHWANSHDATDALFHFFQDAYHLKDWLARDDDLSSMQLDPGELFTNGKRRRKQPARPAGPLSMQICADVCNAIKHFGERWTPEVGGMITRQDATVFPGVAGSSATVVAGAPGSSRPGPPQRAWGIDTDEGPQDALQVAHDIVVAWDRWLVQHGLLNVGEHHQPFDRRRLS
jgi:hypothetical protein